MKSYLLPIAAVAGTLITLGLTGITLAGPGNDAESAATTQVRQMEQQSRMREWSQGLGIALSNGGAMTAGAESGQTASTVSKPTAYIPTPARFAKNNDVHRRHDQRDHNRNDEHEDDDHDESHS